VVVLMLREVRTVGVVRRRSSNGAGIRDGQIAAVHNAAIGSFTGAEEG